MIRLATHTDVAEIAQGLYDLVQNTGWKHYPNDVGVADVEEFVMAKLMDPQCVMYVYERDGKVVAFCGAALGRMFIPPYHRSVYEWGWYGPKREAVKVWQQAVMWGRSKGAKIAGYVSAHPGSRTNVVDEHIIWKVLI